MRPFMIVAAAAAFAANAAAQNAPIFLNSEITVGASPNGIAAGDVNHDGNLDIVIINSKLNQIAVALGGGNGGFGAAATFQVGNGPAALALADFNNDGNLDVVTANSNSGKFTRLLGAGTGAFGSGLNVTVGTYPSDIAAADMNHDGNADVFISISHANGGAPGGVSLAMGDGLGGFAAPAMIPFGSDSARVLAIGELNADGNVDFVSSGYTMIGAPISFYASLGSPAGIFAPPTATVPTWFGVPVSIAIGDFDGDGFGDVASGNFYQPPAAAFLMGNGTQQFSNIISIPFASGQYMRGVAVADLDGDGADEALFTRIGAYLDVVKYDNSTGYKIHSEVAAESIAGKLAVGDFDHDSHPDAAVAIYNSDVVELLRGGPGGIIMSNGVLQFGGNYTKPVVLADLNRDGHPDACAVNYDLFGTTFTINTALNDTLGHFYTISNSYYIAEVPDFLCSADFNEDGVPDVIGVSKNSVLFLGNGLGGLIPHAPFATPNVGVRVGAETGDFNLDGHADVLITTNSNQVYLLSGDGAGNFAWSANGATGAPLQATSTRSADLNRDGALDLAISHYSGFTAAFGDGGGHFPANLNITTGTLNSSCCLADWNGDGWVDAAVLHTTNNSPPSLIPIIMNNSAAALSAGPVLNISSSSVFAAAGGDVDGDGRADLVLSAGGLTMVLRGDGNGGFGPQENYISNAGFLIEADLDLDGRTDFATYTLNSIFTSLNQTGAPQAGLQMFGSGTPGCNGQHALSANRTPNINSPNFKILATNAPPFSTGLCIVGDAIDAAGSDPFGIGVELYINFANVNELFAFDMPADAAGGAAASAPIPNNPMLVGNHYYGSAVFAWTAGNPCQLPPLGLSSSRGLNITILN